MKKALEVFWFTFVAMLVVMLIVLVGFSPLVLSILFRNWKFMFLFLLTVPFVAGILNVFGEGV